MPTWPRPSPTTTSAVNENRRPPLTTLATRLMDTTRSVSSSTLGSIFASATHYLLSLKSQSASAGRVGKRLHPPMVPVASAVEHHPVDPAGLGLLGEELADRLRRGNVAAEIGRASCRERVEITG